MPTAGSRFRFHRRFSTPFGSRWSVAAGSRSALASGFRAWRSSSRIALACPMARRLPPSTCRIASSFTGVGLHDGRDPTSTRWADRPGQRGSPGRATADREGGRDVRGAAGHRAGTKRLRVAGRKPRGRQPDRQSGRDPLGPRRGRQPRSSGGPGPPPVGPTASRRRGAAQQITRWSAGARFRKTRSSSMESPPRVESDGRFCAPVELPPDSSRLVTEVRDPAGHVGRVERDVQVRSSDLFFLALADGVIGQLRYPGIPRGIRSERAPRAVHRRAGRLLSQRKDLRPIPRDRGLRHRSERVREPLQEPG